MPLVIPAGYALGSFRGLVAGDPEEVVFTMGFDLEASGSSAMCDDLFDVWSEALDATTSADFQFVGVTLKEGPNDTGPTFESTASPTLGVVTETGATINTSVLVRKVTSLGGKKGRGRAYTVGQAYQGVYGMSGELDDGHLATLDTAWLSILGGWQAVTGVVGPVLLHSDATTPTAITSLQPVKRLATQRRRLRP